jgi:hypothetical protein
MSEKIDRIVELDIDDDFLEEELEDTGVEIVSIVDRPAIQVDFQYFADEEFIDPRSDESEDDFIGRCMGDSKMVSEYPDEKQRLAVCYSYFEGSTNYELESYDDYPNAARENACRAIIWTDENGWGSCGEATGKRRASQLCMGQKISRETIARMASFKRHQQHKDVPYDEGCGGLMWDAWGGDEGIAWAQRKLDQIDKEKLCERHVMSDEAKTEILKFCEDDNNGTYIGIDDVFLDFTKTEFGVGDVLKSISGLDILKRLVVKKDEPAETYWRYSGPSAQRDFCRAMMNLTNRGKIFTTDEVRKMSGLNSQFAEKGKSSYSILEFGGGVNCVHYWQKLYVFKGNTGNKVVIATNEAVNNEESNALKSQNSNKPGPLGSIPNNARINFSIDEEKRVVLGPLMIPNKFILRRDENGEPYYIYFSRKTIRKMAEKFFKMNNHNNTDINHDENVVTENTLVESWISESMQYDKSNKYGYMLPPGTWFVSYKINDDETWGKIKSGELKGFSLAGGFISKMKVVNPEATLNEIKNILKNVKDD